MRSFFMAANSSSAVAGRAKATARAKGTASKRRRLVIRRSLRRRREKILRPTRRARSLWADAAPAAHEPSASKEPACPSSVARDSRRPHAHVSLPPPWRPPPPPPPRAAVKAPATNASTSRPRARRPTRARRPRQAAAGPAGRPCGSSSKLRDSLDRSFTRAAGRGDRHRGGRRGGFRGRGPLAPAPGRSAAPLFPGRARARRQAGLSDAQLAARTRRRFATRARRAAAGAPLPDLGGTYLFALDASARRHFPARLAALRADPASSTPRRTAAPTPPWCPTIRATTSCGA